MTRSAHHPDKPLNFREFFDASRAVLLDSAEQPAVGLGLEAAPGNYRLQVGRTALGDCVAMVQEFSGTRNRVIGLSARDSAGAFLSSVLRGSHDVSNKAWYLLEDRIVATASERIGQGGWVAEPSGLVLPDEWADPRTVEGLSQLAAQEHLGQLLQADPSRDVLASPDHQRGVLFSAQIGVPIDAVVLAAIGS